MNTLKKGQEKNIQSKNIPQFSFMYCGNSYDYILFLLISDCCVQIRRQTDASSFVKLLNSLPEVYINIIYYFDQHIHEWENFYFWSCRFFFLNFFLFGRQEKVLGKVLLHSVYNRICSQLLQNKGISNVYLSSCWKY